MRASTPATDGITVPDQFVVGAPTHFDQPNVLRARKVVGASEPAFQAVQGFLKNLRGHRELLRGDAGPHDRDRLLKEAVLALDRKHWQVDVGLADRLVDALAI